MSFLSTEIQEKVIKMLLNRIASNLNLGMMITSKSAATVSCCFLPILEVVLAREHNLARLSQGCHAHGGASVTCSTRLFVLE